MSHKIITWDIETSPQPDKVREYNEYDPTTIKYGNTKDEEKRATIATAHEAKFWEEKLDKAALNAPTLNIIAVGLMIDDTPVMHTGKEEDLITLMLDLYMGIKSGDVNASYLVGFNIFGFDLKILFQRAIILGIDIPAGMINGRYYDSIFRDMMVEWSRYGYQEFIGLTRLAKILGVAQPREHGIEGKHFHLALKEDPDKAEQYAFDDLRETHAIAKRLIQN